MNNMQKKQLQDELKAAGASPAELKDLPNIAATLGRLRSASAEATAKPPRRRRLQTAFMIGLPAALCLIIGVLLVMFSQSVLPGSPLYPVQQVSDGLAISADASYRGIVMMKRADQVKALVNNHASSDKVAATLADYQKQAANYKSTQSNYAAFEYCKQSLKQAAAAAPSAEKTAIDHALRSLDSV